MSIANEIARLQQAKSDLATSITNKGVTVPAAATLDGYAALVDSIQQGGGTLPYDAEIEYLQGNGSSYIDTGVKVASTTQFCVNLKLASATKSFVLGGRVSGGNTQIGVIVGNSNKNLNWRWGNNTTESSMTFNAGYYTIDNLSSANKLVGNSLSVTVTAATFSCNYNVFLFADNNGGTAHDFTTAAQIIYAKFYSSGTKVRDFIPVRVGQVGYLYDRVSGELFGNAGTGSFALGPDVT